MHVCHIDNFFLRFNSSADFPGPWAHRSPVVSLFSPCIKNPSGASENKTMTPDVAVSMLNIVYTVTLTPVARAMTAGGVRHCLTSDIISFFSVFR